MNYAILVVDSTDSYKETNEDNNLGTTQWTITCSEGELHDKLLSDQNILLYLTTTGRCMESTYGI